MLEKEIEEAKRRVHTDAYTMSVGEIVSMYLNREIVIDPEFQRLFRWEAEQKSRLIESMLLGIPLPSIFVFEVEDGGWELIDGLQRVSTILEFMGQLREPSGKLCTPSVLEATKYLPSLHNAVWEKTKRITGVAVADQMPLDKVQQLAIRRCRLGVEILKRPSESKTKYDLFQRLNAGGTQANAQELRNCVILMRNAKYFRALKASAEGEVFKTVIALTEDQQEKQRHMELAVRFLVHVHEEYDGKLGVEEYIDEGIGVLADKGDGAGAKSLIDATFSLLDEVAGKDALRRFENGHYVGKVGLVGLEVIAVGVATNLSRIKRLGPKAVPFVRKKSRDFWAQPEVEDFTSPGLRGTLRIQRTVPFGKSWFKP